MSYFLRLPAELELGQSIALEGIALTCSMVLTDLDEMRARIENGSREGRKWLVSELDRLHAFRAAWSAIINFDSLRQLTEELDKTFPIAVDDEAKAAFKSCRKMRNDIQHLRGNIKKLRKKTMHLPIWGILAFTWISSEDFSVSNDTLTTNGINLTLMSMSSALHNVTYDLTQMLDGQLYLPWGNPTLFAFDELVRLDVIDRHARGVITSLQQNVDAAVAANADPARLSGEAKREPFCFTVHEPWNEPVSAPVPKDWGKPSPV